MHRRRSLVVGLFLAAALGGCALPILARKTVVEPEPAPICKIEGRTYVVPEPAELDEDAGR